MGAVVGVCARVNGRDANTPVATIVRKHLANERNNMPSRLSRWPRDKLMDANSCIVTIKRVLATRGQVGVVHASGVSTDVKTARREWNKSMRDAPLRCVVGFNTRNADTHA